MKVIFIIVGWLSLILGTIGAFLPIIPTTPFILLSLFCFAKSSQKLHDKIINNKFYKQYLASACKGEMTLKAKLLIVIPVSCILITGVIFTPFIWVKFLLILLILVKWYFFIFKIKTI